MDIIPDQDDVSHSVYEADSTVVGDTVDPSIGEDAEREGQWTDSAVDPALDKALTSTHTKSRARRNTKKTQPKPTTLAYYNGTQKRALQTAKLHFRLYMSHNHAFPDKEEAEAEAWECISTGVEEVKKEVIRAAELYNREPPPDVIDQLDELGRFRQCLLIKADNYFVIVSTDVKENVIRLVRRHALSKGMRIR